MRSVVCCTALSLSAAAAFGADTRPPRAFGSPSNATDNCYRLHSREGEVVGEVEVTVSIDASGRVRKAELVASSGDETLDSAGVCILHKMSFVPARRNDVSVESTLSWPILVRLPN